MKSGAQTPRWWETIIEQFSPLLICLILALPAALFLGVVIGAFNLVYGLVIVGALIMVIILQLRWDELMVVLIIAVHILVDWYLALRLVSVLMALILLFVCYFGRSANHPWLRPRPIWLWGLFLALTIYPAIKGGRLSPYDAETYYPNLVLSSFIMFWLGNMIAKDISAVRRVFQLLAVFVVFIAIHTIIEATTGKFLFESARAEAILAQNTNYQLVQNLGASVSRASSFLGHPDGNGTFLATGFFLLLGLSIESKQLWAKMIYFLEMPLILLAIMFTYSSASWIALLAGIIAFIFLVGRKRYSMLLLFLIAMLTVIVFTIFPSQLALQLSHLSHPKEAQLHIGSWLTAVRIVETFPLFGIGLGGQAYIIYQEPFRVPEQYVPVTDPNNSYLHWGTMAGIPVMLVFLILLGYVFLFSWRNWQTAGIRYRPLLGGGIAALIALSVSSLAQAGWTSQDGLVNLGWLIAGLVTSQLIGRCQRQQSVPPVDKTEETILAQTEVPEMDMARQGS
jgi:O-antigen ligase